MHHNDRVTIDVDDTGAFDDPPSDPERRPLLLSLVGLGVGLLLGIGIGYMAWGTVTDNAVPGRVGITYDDTPTADELVQQGLTLHNAGDTAGAAAKYTAALEIDPNNSVAMYNLGVIAHFAGDLDTARSRYEQAIASNPQFVSALYNLGLVLRDLGDTDAAIDRLEQAIEIAPDNKAALENLGNLLIAQGQNQRGQELLDRAAALTDSGG